MASLLPASNSSDGYATPVALVFALSLAMVAAALVQRSVVTLKQSKAEFSSFQVQADLDGAQLEAAAKIVRAGAGGPYRWSLASGDVWTEVVAESEAQKLSPKAASQLRDQAFQAFGVEDAAALKTRLVAVAQDATIVDIAQLDDAPLWRLCAPSMVSSLGQANSFTPTTPIAPQVRTAPPAWRIGELWRVRVTTAAGWRDERIVRFTGDALHPAAVVLRQWSRGEGGHGQCDAILAAAA